MEPMTQWLQVVDRLGVQETKYAALCPDAHRLYMDIVQVRVYIIATALMCPGWKGKAGKPVELPGIRPHTLSHSWPSNQQNPFCESSSHCMQSWLCCGQAGKEPDQPLYFGDAGSAPQHWNQQSLLPCGHLDFTWD